ncbi:MAG: hypothetical protein EON95_02690 [Caulobacteraceae bacterium]|nr:MAG: hypothetical protein EON95_02690 [Caulobacteraceae bacterium]
MPALVSRSAPWAAAFAALALFGSAGAQSGDWADSKKGARKYPESQAICRSLKTATAPAGDRPTKAQAAALKDCDSVDLYYGLGGAPDRIKARRCAFVQLDSKPDDLEDGVSGAGVLAMIYANGDGVSRNLDFAIHMACLDAFSPFEIDSRVKALDARRRGEGLNEPYDYCDEASSGFAMGECSAIWSGQETVKRNARFAAAGRTWNPVQRKAFAKLSKAREAYVEARVDNEVDLSGTARTVSAMAARDQIRDFDIELLEALTKGAGPGADRLTLTRDDAALNDAFRRLMADRGAFPAKADIRRTQRLWLAYRDSWAGFMRLTWPTKADAVVAYVTRQRTIRLLCMLDDGDAHPGGDVCLLG